MGVVLDRHYTEPRLAEVYDAVCSGRPDWSFYLPLVMAAQSVLDVGCGTGELLHLARGQGHTGRLCGLDPAEAMLDVARRESDIEWVLDDPAFVKWYREFDLIVMTGNAFQVFLEDDDVRAALASIRSALTDDGRFAFETRNPAGREWERWSARTTNVMHDGVAVTLACPEPEFDGRFIRFGLVYTSPNWEAPEVSESTIRVFSVEELAAFLAEAGLTLEAQYGDFERQPLTDSSLEIVTVARRG